MSPRVLYSKENTRKILTIFFSFDQISILGKQLMHFQEINRTFLTIVFHSINPKKGNLSERMLFRVKRYSRWHYYVLRGTYEDDSFNKFQKRKFIRTNLVHSQVILKMVLLDATRNLRWMKRVPDFVRKYI